MFNSFLTIDESLTFFVNQLLLHNNFFDRFFSFFSIEGISIAIWIVIAVLLIFLEEKKSPGMSKKDKHFIILFSLSLLLTFFSVNYLFKPLFHRSRPTTISNLKFKIINCPDDFSFPSSHAATAFAAATILVFFDKKRRGFYWTIAVLISLSRIYLGCHYFFDIVVGAIIGYFVSKLIVTKLRI